MREFLDVALRRLENVRALAANYGSCKALGQALGLTKSAMSQLIGSKPVRGISEKSARRWEQSLGLNPYSLDQTPMRSLPLPDAPRLTPAAPQPSAAGWEVQALDTTMSEVDRALGQHGVRLSPDKYRLFVTYIYRSAIRAGGQVDPTDVNSLVKLLTEGNRPA